VHAAHAAKPHEDARWERERGREREREGGRERERGEKERGK
jgi:hypothetical protein